MILSFLVAMNLPSLSLHDRFSSCHLSPVLLLVLLLLRLASILLRHCSACVGGLFPSLFALHPRHSNVSPWASRLSCLMTLSVLHSHTVKWHWWRRHRIHPDLRSDLCPSSVCESPRHASHVVDHHFVPSVLLLQSGDFANPEHLPSSVPTKHSALFFLAPSHVANLYLGFIRISGSVELGAASTFWSNGTKY